MSRHEINRNTIFLFYFVSPPYGQGRQSKAFKLHYNFASDEPLWFIAFPLLIQIDFQYHACSFVRAPVEYTKHKDFDETGGIL